MIVQKEGKYFLYSKDGSKKLGGPYDTREGTVKRERQVQYFKHVKHAAFIKQALAVDFSGHFWDRVFSRPQLKNDINNMEEVLKNIGGKDSYVEDIPELKYILRMPNKRFLFQAEPSKPKYVFALKENPASGKHSLVAITGLNSEYYSGNLEDITSVLLLVSNQQVKNH